jgi:leukotriene-A4 hydrolase
MAASNLLEQSSLSNYMDVSVTNISILFHVNFALKQIFGQVTYDCIVHSDNCSVLSFDTSNLSIKNAYVEGEECPFSLEEYKSPFGSKLSLLLKNEKRKGDRFSATVIYNTTSESAALQWLEPSQTSGKKFPYLFSQCQAIHARSLLPCQDTPGVKATYNARVVVDSPLVVLMSAISLDRSGVKKDEFESLLALLGEPVSQAETGGEITPWIGANEFTFTQKVPIPSYLIAIAAGNLVSSDISPRCRVWSEPEVIEAAAWEFKDTEKFVSAGETLCGPYVWSRYDFLILAQAFPYGGMENACMTFLTPTLLAGDRSLVNVVAHEAAHSWTGNLVTNSTWNSFWLNESFTMFVERKILSLLNGKQVFDFDAISGEKDLAGSVSLFLERMQPEYTKLVPDLTGVDPDDSFSTVPYEKGFHLLVHIERIVGEEAMKCFLKDYIQVFKYKSITADDFKRYVCAYFEEGRYNLPRVNHSGLPYHQGKCGAPSVESDIQLLSGLTTSLGPTPSALPASSPVPESTGIKGFTEMINWEEWFYGIGMPPVKLTWDTSMRDAVTTHANEWILDPVSASAKALEVTASWSSEQRIAFLEELVSVSTEKKSHHEIFSIEFLQMLDSNFEFSKKKNAEIVLLWCTLGIRSNFPGSTDASLAFLSSQGRMKYTRPIFRELLRSAVTCETAVQYYSANSGNFHPICAKMVKVDIEKELSSPTIDPRNIVAGPVFSLLSASGKSVLESKKQLDSAVLASSIAVEESHVIVHDAAKSDEIEKVVIEEIDEEEEDEEEDGDEEEDEEEEEEEEEEAPTKARGGLAFKRRQINQKKMKKQLKAMQEALPAGQVFEVVSDAPSSSPSPSIPSDQIELKRKEFLRIAELREKGLSSVDAVKQARAELGLETSPGFLAMANELEEENETSGISAQTSKYLGSTGTAVLTKIKNTGISPELESVVTSVAAVSCVALIGYLAFSYVRK